MWMRMHAKQSQLIHQLSLKVRHRAYWMSGRLSLLSGITFAVASISGRNVENSQAPFAEMPDLGAAMYIGSYNGAVVLGPGLDGPRRLLGEQRLSAEAFREAVDYIGEGRFNFVYCRCEVDEEGVREAYMTDRKTASVQGLMDLGVRFVIDGDLLSRIKEGELGPSPKLIVMPGLERLEAVLEEMRRIFGQRLYLARTGDDRVDALAAHAAKLTSRPTEMTAEDLDMLRSHGLSDLDLIDVNNRVAYYNYTNRVVMGLGLRSTKSRTEDAENALPGERVTTAKS